VSTKCLNAVLRAYNHRDERKYSLAPKPLKNRIVGAKRGPSIRQSVGDILSAALFLPLGPLVGADELSLCQLPSLERLQHIVS
jgi:hypothetical protein